MLNSTKPIECSKSTIEKLQAMANDPSEPRLAVRASIVLACIAGESGKSIAERFHEREATVSKWKKRFLTYGVEGLKNEPRGYSGKMYGKPFRERLLAMLRSNPPEGEKYWTCRTLAEALGVPGYVVTRYLRVEGIHLMDERKSRMESSAPETDDSQGTDGSVSASGSMPDEPSVSVIPEAYKVEDSSALEADDPLVSNGSLSGSGNTPDGSSVSAIPETDSEKESLPPPSGTFQVTELGSGKIIPDQAPALVFSQENQTEYSAGKGSIDDAYGLEVTFRIYRRDGSTVTKSTARSDECIPGSDTFRMDTLEGFREDFDTYEKSLIKARDMASGQVTEGLLEELSKKKKMTGTELSVQPREMDTELGRVTMNVPETIAAGFKPKERILSIGQEELLTMACSVMPYEKAVEFINRVQHRSVIDRVCKKTVSDYISRTGKDILEKKLAAADKILSENGFDPETLAPAPADTLPECVVLPPDDSGVKRQELYKDIMNKYNEGKEEAKQIKDPVLIEQVELVSDNTVYIGIEDVGISRQKENRSEGEAKPPGKPKRTASKKYVQNTVVKVLSGKNSYNINANSMINAFKQLLAVLIVNGLLNGKVLVFFADGAEIIRDALEKFFPFLHFRLYLDWYHLEKKTRELLSMAVKGKKDERTRIREEVNQRLWAGNIDDAVSYIRDLPDRNIKNTAMIEETVSYWNRKRPYICCYALRSLLGYRSLGSAVEKANDILAAKRQMNKGMSWSDQGSTSLTSIITLLSNHELEGYLHHRTVAFKFQQSAEPAWAAFLRNDWGL